MTTTKTPATVQTIAVLGGGHGAVAAAGDLTARGFTVALALRNRPRFAELFETGRVSLEGALELTAELDTVTDDHAAAVAGADLVFIPLPAPAQIEMIDRIAPALEEDQVICLSKGTFSAFVAARQLERLQAARVPVAEMPILPYGVRMTGEAAARIALVAEHLPTGVYPAVDTERALERIRLAYPAAEPAQDALDAALSNIDPSLHAPLVCMNAGPIQGLESFDVHVQGSTPAVVAVSVALDEERIALRRALGYGEPHWPLRDFYEGTGTTFYGPDARRETKGKSVWNEKIDFSHRYVAEDIGCGLALFSSLGRLLEVPTPLADALLAVMAPVTGHDYRTEGRTLERLGLGGLTPAEIQTWLRTGTQPADGGTGTP